MDMDEEFGPWLKKRRAALDLTQEKLAELVGCSVEAIRAFERGKRKPSRETAVRLAVELNIPDKEQAAFILWARGKSSPAIPLDKPPAPVTSLVGRVEQINQVGELLERKDVRLVTLTGPGGMGKTRLGLEVAAQLRTTFTHGVSFVDLAPVNDPTLVGTLIAQRLGLRDAPDQPLLERLIHFLRDKRLLLLLDNFEHVLNAGSLIIDLLAASPHLKVLVTSRSVLHVSGEFEFPVRSLKLPSPEPLSAPETLSRCESVELFIARAQAVNPDFQITRTNAPTIAEICTRLDGMPLAIELAAAWCKMFTPAGLLKALKAPFNVLTGGPRNVAPRQQTLRNTIDWSYNLLDPSEQALFQRLAVFVGGATLEAIEAVCGGIGEDHRSILDTFHSLADNSLLQPVEIGDESRFTMLETIREYALERLAASGNDSAVRQRHAEYFVTFVEAIEQRKVDHEQDLGLDRLERDHDNLRAALGWLIDQGWTEMALRLEVALNYFWILHGYLSEGRSWLHAALTQESTVPQALRARALGGAGSLAWRQGDYAEAMQLLNAGLKLFQDLNDRVSSSWMLINLGKTHLDQGNDAQAKRLIEEGLTLFQAEDQKEGVAWALTTLGEVAVIRKELAHAQTRFRQSLQQFQEIQNKYGIACVLAYLGKIALVQGNTTEATSLLAESLMLFPAHRDKRVVAFAIETLAGIAVSPGERSSKNLNGSQSAARLLGAAGALRLTIGAPITPSERLQVDQAIAAIHTSLGETAYTAAWAEGQTMQPEDAIALALEWVEINLGAGKST